MGHNGLVETCKSLTEAKLQIKALEKSLSNFRELIVDKDAYAMMVRHAPGGVTVISGEFSSGKPFSELVAVSTKEMSKERIAALEADRIAQAEMIVALRADLADERKRKRELELILENVEKVIKATLGP